MLTLAYTECGLTVDEFLNLSFYEWGLEIQKLRKRYDRRREDWESSALLTRELMAIICNSSGKVFKKEVKGSELMPLSIDKPKKVEIDEDILASFPKTLK